MYSIYVFQVFIPKGVLLNAHHRDHDTLPQPVGFRSSTALSKRGSFKEKNQKCGGYQCRHGEGHKKPRRINQGLKSWSGLPAVRAHRRSALKQKEASLKYGHFVEQRLKSSDFATNQDAHAAMQDMMASY